MLGVIVFDETLAQGDGRLIPAVIGLVVALFGVSMLAGEEQPGPDDAGSGSPAAIASGPHRAGNQDRLRSTD